MRDKWSPLTRSEAIEFAQDIAGTMIDARLHPQTPSDTAPRCVCMEKTIMHKTNVVWKGWEVRLSLEQSHNQEVIIRVGYDGFIKDIDSCGKWLGLFLRGYPVEANRLTAKTLNGGDRMVAALTAVDYYRLLDHSVINWYVNNIYINEDGEWIVKVGNVDGFDCCGEVRLSAESFSLLGFKRY